MFGIVCSRSCSWLSDLFPCCVRSVFQTTFCLQIFMSRSDFDRYQFLVTDLDLTWNIWNIKWISNVSNSRFNLKIEPLMFQVIRTLYIGQFCFNWKWLFFTKNVCRHVFQNGQKRQIFVENVQFRNKIEIWCLKRKPLRLWKFTFRCYDRKAVL